MVNKKIAEGTVHKMPADLRKALATDKKVTEKWEGLTPLARNEWICWNINVKQQVTRDKHVKQTIEDLAKGKRRPCCWIGCIHRTDKAISPSVKGILRKKKIK